MFKLKNNLNKWDQILFLSICCLNIVLIPFFFNNDTLIQFGLLIGSLFPLFFLLDKWLMPKFIIGPAVLIYLYHLFGYSIGPIFQHYYFQRESFLLAGMILAQKYAYLGLIIFLITYIITFSIVNIFQKKYFLLKINFLKSENYKPYTFILVLFVLSYILFGYLTEISRRIGGIGAADKSLFIQSIFYGFWYIQFICFFFLGYSVIKEEKKIWLIASLFMLGIYIIYQITEGNRGPILLMTLSYATGIAWAGYSKLKIAFYGLSCILIVVLLSGPIYLYRNDTNLNQYRHGILSRIAQFNNATISFYTDKANVKYIFEPFVVAVTALTVDRVMVLTPSEIPFSGFNGMEALRNIYFPKFINPNRLDINDGNKVAEIYGIPPGTKNTYFYVTAVGEGYRRFGWVGVVLSYAFSGVFFGACFSFFLKFKNSAVSLSMLILIFLHSPGAWAFTYNYGIYFFFYTVPKYFLAFFIIYQISKYIFKLLMHLKVRF